MSYRLLPLLIFLAFLLLLVFTTTDGKEPRRAVMTELLAKAPPAPRCAQRVVVLPQLDGSEWTFLIPNLDNCQET